MLGFGKQDSDEGMKPVEGKLRKAEASQSFRTEGISGQPSSCRGLVLKLDWKRKHQVLVGMLMDRVG